MALRKRTDFSLVEISVFPTLSELEAGHPVEPVLSQRLLTASHDGGHHLSSLIWHFCPGAWFAVSTQTMINSSTAGQSTGTRPHALFLIDSLESAHGTEMLAVILAHELVAQGWQVSFYTARYTPGRSPWTPALQARSIRVYRPWFGFLRRFQLPHRQVVALLRHHARIRHPALIWSPTNDILTCLALQQRPGPSIPFFVHDPSEASPACPNYEPLWFKVCNQVTALSVHGERQLQSAKEYYQMTRPVEIVRPSSLPALKVSKLDLDKEVLRLGQFGRLATMKGSLFSVAALADCLSRGGKAELHFFGDGPMKPATQELAYSLGISGKVLFHGRYHPEQLDTLAAGIDVGLMPSTYEGFGLVMLEMLSRGRPVIASDVGSSQEVLGGGGGWVVPKANTVALADAMLDCCLNRPEVLRKAAEGPIVWANQFTPAKMAERYLAFWSSHCQGLPPYKSCQA
ncbi:glycosyltransferase family 4 protein [Verrucomicrobium spinosum]|uniref:glycosyltransferase family 4 protein n=1 Tax=Verrucomicrobium spinosum TaxID=2736 RepID=UPI0018DD3816|nr:glycosyltransferase family 4 protein [Verrucomicrobium spinosum]